MLLDLHLSNLGVISEARVPLAAGLNVVTGETGVGKTLLVGSLGFVTGARTGPHAVRSGARAACVEAVAAPPPRLRALLEARGLEVGEEVVLAREVAAGGRSRAWLDGRLVPLSLLAEAGEALVEIHAQGAGFALARPREQIRALDAFAGTQELAAAHAAAHSRLRALEREEAALVSEERARARESDLLAYQVAEIEGARLEPGEDERLELELARLEHTEQLAAAAAAAAAAAGPEGAAGVLAECQAALDEVARLDPLAAELGARAAALAAESAELGRDARRWAEGLEADPRRLEEARARRAVLASLKRKYGASVEDILAWAKGARERLEALEGRAERAGTLAKERARATEEVGRLARELRRRRRRAARELARLVSGELSALALHRARFEVAVEEAQSTEMGGDRIEFLFSSTPEGPLAPIGKVASGGELSRAMIALTLVLAASHDVPVLAFDEADQGVGGRAALELARRLARLGRAHQVLVVTHLPQIAAFADHHLAVVREGSSVEVRVLEGEERSREISRMLGGLESSRNARAHAGELLEMAAAEAAAGH